LVEFRENTKQLRKKEAEMQFGFKLFQIVYSTSPDMTDVEKEIDNLDKVWNIK